MAYSEKLANRIREQIAEIKNFEEKEMFGGIAFMLNNKMCVGVIKDELMCRIDPSVYADALEKPGCREMDFTHRPMKGWIMVGEEGMKKPKDLAYWIDLAVSYNKDAPKSARKKKSKKS